MTMRERAEAHLNEMHINGNGPPATDSVLRAMTAFAEAEVRARETESAALERELDSQRQRRKEAEAVNAALRAELQQAHALLVEGARTHGDPCNDERCGYVERVRAHLKGSP